MTVTRKALLYTILIGLLAQPLLAKQPGVGSKAINFTLTNFEGKETTLSDLKGNVVILDFWASWCKPCREELPFLDLLRKQYGRAGLKVVAVNIDNKAQNALEFMKAYDIELDALWDRKKEVVAAYDVQTMPTTFVIDQNGRIRFINAGFEAEKFQEYKRQVQKLLIEAKKRSRKPGTSNG